MTSLLLCNHRILDTQRHLKRCLYNFLNLRKISNSGIFSVIIWVKRTRFGIYVTWIMLKLQIGQLLTIAKILPILVCVWTPHLSLTVQRRYSIPFLNCFLFLYVFSVLYQFTSMLFRMSKDVCCSGGCLWCMLFVLHILFPLIFSIKLKKLYKHHLW